MTWGRRVKRATMTAYESAQCDRALRRLADYFRWRAMYPKASYAAWPLLRERDG